MRSKPQSVQTPLNVDQYPSPNNIKSTPSPTPSYVSSNVPSLCGSKMWTSNVSIRVPVMMNSTQSI